MNYLADFNTIKEGMKELERGIKIANTLGYSIYHDALIGDCYKIKNKLFQMGANEDEINEIMKRLRLE